MTFTQAFVSARFDNIPDEIMNTLIDVLVEKDPKFGLLSNDKQRAARKKVSKVLQVVFDLVGVFLHNFQLTDRELKNNG